MEHDTFLDQLFLSLEPVPLDLRRDFELIKELDRMNIALTAELRGIEAQYLNRLSKNRAYADAKVTQKMEALRERIHRRHVEKTSIGRNMLSELERFLRKMDVDLAFFETELRNSGTGGDLFEQAKLSIEPGSDVAVRVSSTSDDYILGRVIFYNVETSIYDIADADESSSKRYSVPESSVILLDLDYNQTVRRLAKGEAVLAVYPETTSFYPALVTILFFLLFPAHRCLFDLFEHFVLPGGASATQSRVEHGAHGGGAVQRRPRRERHHPPQNGAAAARRPDPARGVTTPTELLRYTWHLHD